MLTHIFVCFILDFLLHLLCIKTAMNNSSATATLQTNEVGMKVLKELLPIAIAITLANGLVFALFYKRRNLRTSSNYLLLGLAVCDFVTGAVNIPYFIVFCFQVVPRTMQKDFTKWLYILHTLMAVVAAYHIFIITAEKYFAIIRPLKHYLITKKMVLKVLAAIWITSAFIAVIPLAWENNPQSVLYLIIHSSVCLVLVFAVPYAFMIYAYIVMFKAITSKTRPSSTRRVRTSKSAHKKTINDRKCILVFAAMAAIFAFCWLPYFTIMLVLNIKHYFKLHISQPMLAATEAFAIVRYMTSVTNPLLYTFFKRDFWQSLRNLPLRSKYSNRRTSSNSRDQSLVHSTLNRKRFFESTILSRMSWVGEPPPQANNKLKTNMGEEQIAFISSV